MKTPERLAEEEYPDIKYDGVVIFDLSPHREAFIAGYNAAKESGITVYIDNGCLKCDCKYPNFRYESFDGGIKAKLVLSK